MKKIYSRITAAAALSVLLVSVSFAWFRNNRTTELSGADIIRVKGNGMMMTAYAVDGTGAALTETQASYGSNLQMLLSGQYMDVSGDGLHIYEASLDTTGQPIVDEWTEAEADHAEQSTDKGKYVVAELYFKSDVPMDIFLLKESSVSPKSNGGDLTNAGSYGSYTLFSEFTAMGGLPSLNINQSSFGLFSRNLIAGAARVGFAQYSYADGGWVEPEYPTLVWVPNSKYQLTVRDNREQLYGMNMNGTKETEYSYYAGDPEGALETVPRVTLVSGQYLTGNMYIKKTDGGVWEKIDAVTVDHDLMVPAKILQNYAYPVPQLWNGSAFTDAAYSESLECLVEAEYNNSYALSTGYAYVTEYNSTEIRVQKTESGYKRVKLSAGNWTDEGTTYTTEEAIAEIEAGFRVDQGTYIVTDWIDEDDFNSLTQDQTLISDRKLGSTEAIDDSGSCYARIRVTIWVEGYDRESNIALNTGEFYTNLQFYGVEK